MLPPEWLGVERLLVGQLGACPHLNLLLEVLRGNLPGVQVTVLSPSEVPSQQLIERLQSQSFQAAILFTGPGQSPYPVAYACHLAGIPLRLGQSQEFAGGVLSHWVKPLPGLDLLQHDLHLLASLGFELHPSQLERSCLDFDQRRSQQRMLNNEGLPGIDAHMLSLRG